MDIRLTPPKIEILHFIYDIRFARTSQIHEVLFYGKCRRQTQHYLSQMYKEQLLHRVFPFAQRGSEEAVYMLGHLGRYALTELLELDSVQELKWDERDNTVGIEKKEHTLAITEMRVQLAGKLRADPELQLVRFIGERQVGRIRYSVKTIYGETEGREINPDAYLEIADKRLRKRSSYYLEFDTGAESTAKIVEKVNSYVDFYDSKEFPYRNAAPPVLIVSRKNLSLQKFSEAVTYALEKRRSKGNDPRITFFGCSEAAFMGDPTGEVFRNMETGTFMGLAAVK